MISFLASAWHQYDDLFVADCPEMGTVSQGKIVDQAIANLKEATELHLEEFPLSEDTIPVLTSFEVNNAQIA